jgi:hypothetical protein
MLQKSRVALLLDFNSVLPYGFSEKYYESSILAYPCSGADR